MPTPDPAQACPALHQLNGLMGRDDQGRDQWPTHAPDDDGRCRHCQPQAADRRWGYGR
ncbi:hypothetical protein [Brooklawnia cerclae]|uniref:Uncharacterized protein n=1 Tax=Brooklawnia cerclae TaxID=349934 RepID=A0ABX0SKH7_9ACTN|nr:hypothetical protein [Brooklawnia cerclae]NIH58516.1 hypothetical protein [Brooklawnia cerclae]